MIPGSRILPDPRRRGRRRLLAVWCWCGRFYTVTPEDARRAVRDDHPTCPARDCGQGTK